MKLQKQMSNGAGLDLCAKWSAGMGSGLRQDPCGLVNMMWSGKGLVSKLVAKVALEMQLESRFGLGADLSKCKM